jgi:hypothetical protein
MTEFGSGRICIENVSSCKAAECLDAAAAFGYLHPGDTLVAWKHDRLGRPVEEVLTIADKPLRQLLQGRGKSFTMTAALAGSSGPSSTSAHRGLAGGVPELYAKGR